MFVFGQMVMGRPGILGLLFLPDHLQSRVFVLIELHMEGAAVVLPGMANS